MKTKNRVLSLFLAVVMFVTALPLTVLQVSAADGDTPKVEILDYELNGNQFTITAQVTLSGGGVECYGFAYSINGKTTEYDLTYEEVGKWEEFTTTITVNSGDTIWFEAIVRNEYGLEGKDSDSFAVPEEEPEIELDAPEITQPDKDGDDIFYAGEDIEFRWTNVWEADQFEWELHKSNKSGKYTKVDSGYTNKPVTIDGEIFKVGYSYIFKVRSCCGNVTSEWDSINIYIDASPELSADPEKLVFGATAGENSFYLTSSHVWEADVSVNWIDLSYYDGTGNEEIIVYVDKNTGEQRTGVITITSDVGSITIEVQQDKGVKSYINVDPSKMSVSSDEKYYSFSVESNVVNWEVYSDYDWIDSISNVSFDHNADIRFSVDENNSTESRTGTIIVTGGGITKTVTVTQDGRSAIVGDINNDGEITNKDRFILNRYLANMAGYTDIDKTLADINGDGFVTTADVEYLSRYLAGWIGYEKLPEINTGTSVCAHTQYTDTYFNTVYVSSTIKTNTTHTYHHVYNRKCSCGVDIGKVQGELITEAHSYVNSLCACGAYNDASYKKWTGVNVSGAQANVYSTPSATVRYGYINKNEVVTVIGEYGDKYLIEYALDGGNGVKQGYVDKSCVEKSKPYSIYIDDEYFVEDVNYYDAEKLLVAEHGTICPIKIHNLLLNTYEDYGVNGIVIESSNTDVVDINNSGQVIIKGTGRAQLFLKYNGELQDTVDVFGCNYWTFVNNDDTLDHEFSPAKGDGLCCIAGKVNMFDYNSVYVSDSSKDGGGYHLVTFNLYNSSVATFSVMVYNKDGTIYDQELIAAHSEGGMFDQMWVHLSNINDIWNGDMLSGKSETMSTKTPITIKVPLGGAVCITSGSDYVFKENVINLLLLAMDTLGGINGISKDLGGYSLDVDACFKKLSEALGIPEIELAAKIFKILSDKGDVGDAITAMLGMIFDADEGITPEDVMKIYLDSLMNVPQKVLKSAVDKLIEKGLSYVPGANVIVGVTDTLCAGGAVYLLIRAMRQYNDFDAHLIIHYSTAP